MFCSVERELDPTLVDVPLIVLSNNDGCAVSRTDEAKALGVRMGDPWFKLREKPHLSALVARSSNYAEYGGYSSRFHTIVAGMSAVSCVYSVDEAFFETDRRDPAGHVAAVQHRVRRWTGLPTAAGVGSTKVLAKVAQRHAKTTRSPLVDLTTWKPGEVRDLLAETPVSEVWGVGRRLTAGLARLDVHTALDLALVDPGVLRRGWSVVVERTGRELAGVPCMPVEYVAPQRKQIMFSRMLGRTVDSPQEMGDVLASYAASAARRLRIHDLEAALMTVWISSSRFRDHVEHKSISVALDPPTSDPLRLVEATRPVLARMRTGHPHNRAGVLLTGLTPAGSQPALWGGSDPARERLAVAVDELARRHGRAVVGYGLAGLRTAPRWEMRRERLSPAATTSWAEVLTVR